MIAWGRTVRGFGLGTFRDCYGAEASVQDSSSAEGAKCWLGLDAGTHVEGKCLARMHLTQEQAREIAAVLLRFADTGSVEPDATEGEAT